MIQTYGDKRTREFAAGEWIKAFSESNAQLDSNLIDWTQQPASKIWLLFPATDLSRFRETEQDNSA